ncbi:MAG: hypothetical protein ACN6O3_15005 [Comamonas sp.]
MTNIWIRSLQTVAVAAALAVVGTASADAAQHAKKPAASQRHDRSGPNGEPANADRLANPVGTPDDFARNAVARCSAFKTQEDQRACVERVRQPVTDGSVGGGGVLREYTYTVPANQ